MNKNPLFSILIPTWNNLPYLKLCIESIRKNSTYHHQILLFINDGSDGTLKWAESQEIRYVHSPENVGIC
ncbi:MAG: glycosyltransferase, partial [Rikenellaceae bacterium]|nr:glycosyltransferase [Rikenellaceae bacterium]